MSHWNLDLKEQLEVCPVHILDLKQSNSLFLVLQLREEEVMLTEELALHVGVKVINNGRQSSDVLT